MEFDITTLIQAVIALVSVCITTFLIPYIKSKTTTAEQTELNTWVKIAVTAAEQLYNGSGRGAEKKEYVTTWLAERNIKYDEAKIDAMIEAAVYELKTNGIINTDVDGQG